MKKKIKRVKSNIFHVIIVAIKKGVTYMTSENLPFLKKVSVTRMFCEFLHAVWK